MKKLRLAFGNKAGKNRDFTENMGFAGENLTAEEIKNKLLLVTEEIGSTV